MSYGLHRQSRQLARTKTSSSAAVIDSCCHSAGAAPRTIAPGSRSPPMAHATWRDHSSRSLRPWVSRTATVRSWRVRSRRQHLLLPHEAETKAPVFQRGRNSAPKLSRASGGFLNRPPQVRPLPRVLDGGDHKAESLTTRPSLRLLRRRWVAPSILKSIRRTEPSQSTTPNPAVWQLP